MEIEEKDVKKERKVKKRNCKLSRKKEEKGKINFATVLQIFERKSDKKKGKVLHFWEKRGEKGENREKRQ